MKRAGCKNQDLTTFVGSVYINTPVVNRNWASRLYQYVACIYEDDSIAHVQNAIVASRIGTPIHFVQLVLAMEDKRFWIHPGLDPIGIGRAILMKTLRKGRRQGASTISEQVVKLRRQQTGPTGVVRRALRAVAAISLTFHEPKVDILVEYLQRVYLGGSSYGVASASQSYFHCSHSELTPSQAFFISERIALPNKWRPARLVNALRRQRIRALIGDDLENVSLIYGKFFGPNAESEVYRICFATTMTHES